MPGEYETVLFIFCISILKQKFKYVKGDIYMTIEEVILMLCMLPIVGTAIIMLILWFVDYSRENNELQNIIHRKNAIIFSQAREIHALNELLSESEQSVQTLLRERKVSNESQNSCS